VHFEFDAVFNRQKPWETERDTVQSRNEADINSKNYRKIYGQTRRGGRVAQSPPPREYATDQDWRAMERMHCYDDTDGQSITAATCSDHAANRFQLINLYFYILFCIRYTSPGRVCLVCHALQIFLLRKKLAYCGHTHCINIQQSQVRNYVSYKKR